MDRKFEISPKPDHSWLVNQRWAFYEPKALVANAIVANAMELEGGVDWKIILPHLECTHLYRRYTGKSAITFSIAATIGSVAVHMGWDMHSPEVVYMSGYHFVWVLRHTIERSVATRNQDEMNLLHEYETRLNESLTDYTSQYLPQDEKYLDILRALMYLNSQSFPGLRDRICGLLKNGDMDNIDRAYGVLTKVGLIKTGLVSGKSG